MGYGVLQVYGLGYEIPPEQLGRLKILWAIAGWVITGMSLDRLYLEYCNIITSWTTFLPRPGF